MTDSSDDYRVGRGRPPRETRWKKGQSGDGHRKPKPPETTVATIDRLLSNRMQITLNGEARKVSALEAIIFQLLQKARSGSGRAFRVLLQYREFASLNMEKKLKLTFVESEYTRAFSAKASSSDDE